MAMKKEKKDTSYKERLGEMKIPVDKPGFFVITAIKKDEVVEKYRLNISKRGRLALL